MTKVAARKAAQRALPKMEKCEMCGATGVKMNRHHTDYSKPTEVLVLCTKCHAKVHMKPPIIATCVVCGSRFLPNDHKARAKLCGNEKCRAEYGRVCANRRWNISGTVESRTSQESQTA